MPMPADRELAYWELIRSGASIGQITAFAIGLMSADGDLAAAGFIADRTEGAPEQTVRSVAITSDDLAHARESVDDWERTRRGGPTPAAPAEAPKRKRGAKPA